MRRAFAKIGDVRFLASTLDPALIFAEEKCYQPLNDRPYWHSAGVVRLLDARKSAQHGLRLQWMAPHGACVFKRHGVMLSAEQVRLILVQLDACLEVGMPRRCARELA